jgi:hypothetical protein
MLNLIYISRNTLHVYVTKVNTLQACCHFFIPDFCPRRPKFYKAPLEVCLQY